MGAWITILYICVLSLELTHKIKMAVCLVLFLFLSLMLANETSCQCLTQQSIQGMALKGHTFKTSVVKALHLCDFKCDQDDRCRSFNYVIQKNVCELNNRTKDEEPEHFVRDKERFYIIRLRQKVKNRNFTGSFYQ